MAATAEGLKAYLRLPEDSAEDLTVYLAAAKSKARAAGVPEYASNARYDLFLYVLAAMYYDARGMELSEQAQAGGSIQRLINSFVLELRHAGEDSAGETESGA